MRLVLMTGLVLLGFAGMPGKAVAQTPGTVPIAPGPETLSAAAQLRLLAVQPLHMTAPVGELVTQGSRGDRRQGEILMIVGAAGIVTGLLVDEDLITIAGAAVGGFGLYLYLQATR